MKLKYQLLSLALLSLIFPLTAWIALKSVDQQFRIGIEQAAQNTLTSLKASIQQILANNSDLILKGLVLANLDEHEIDGDDREWQSVTAYKYHNQQDQLSVKIATFSDSMILFLQTNDDSLNINNFNTKQNDHIIIAVANERGLYKYTFQRQAEGFIDTNSESKPRVKAYWHEKASGYNIEIQFENDNFTNLGFAVIDKEKPDKPILGTIEEYLTQAENIKLLPLISKKGKLNEIIQQITPINNHFTIKDNMNRVIFESNKLPDSQAISSWQWLITPIYKWLFSINNNKQDNQWFYRQSDGMAGVKQSMMVGNHSYELKSMMPQGQANMIQSLLKASVMMMAVVLLLMMAYLSYALFLAWRIKNLNRTMQSVLDDSGQVHVKLPSHQASDEIGQLSRGIGSMLVDIRQYTQYLKDLGSRLSHEMKTPLAIVQSSLDNLEYEHNPEFLKRAQSGTKRLRFILNQLSELSQLKYTLEHTPKTTFDLTHLILQLGQSYQSVIGSVKLKIQPEPINIHGSQDLIGQMMDKLMDNAKDFISESGYIEISLRQSVTNKNTAELLIFNTDSQLPNNNLNIFDSLVSIRDTTSNHSNHLGLGLHLVQLITRYHQAEIKAENTSNPKGVLFTISFNLS